MTRLFHVSDVHFGLEDTRALAWFAQCVADEKPDGIALTGDLTMRARHREFDAASNWIRSLGPPVTIEVGNHDLPYFSPLERLFTPYKRFRKIERMVERELDLPGVSLVSLKTTARAQMRTNWSLGVVTQRALSRTLEAIAAVPRGNTILVCAHHPLVERNARGTLLTRHGSAALDALAQAGAHAVLTGHVHDAFDLVRPTASGPIRMIGAGTLSKRIRSTPASFNDLTIEHGHIAVVARNLEALHTSAMQIEDVPQDATPPKPGEPIAPAASQSATAGGAVADGRDMADVLPPQH